MPDIGQEYDRAGRATHANLLHQLDPFLFGQKKVRNHDIGSNHVEGRQAQRRGRGGNHRMPLRVRMLQYHGLRIGIVGNNEQDTRLGARFGCGNHDEHPLDMKSRSAACTPAKRISTSA